MITEEEIRKIQKAYIDACEKVRSFVSTTPIDLFNKPKGINFNDFKIAIKERNSLENEWDKKIKEYIKQFK